MSRELFAAELGPAVTAEGFFVEVVPIVIQPPPNGWIQWWKNCSNSDL
jgi:hypothetical protein